MLFRLRILIEVLLSMLFSFTMLCRHVWTALCSILEERRRRQNRVPSCHNQRYYGESLQKMPMLLLIATLLLHSMLPRQASIVVGTPTLLLLLPLLVHCYCIREF